MSIFTTVEEEALRASARRAIARSDRLSDIVEIDDDAPIHVPDYDPSAEWIQVQAWITVRREAETIR